MAQHTRQKSDPLPPAHPIDVYYNALCPVSRGGIELEKRRLVEAKRDQRWARFVPVATASEALAGTGLAMEQVRRQLYVRDASGKLHRGIDGAALMLQSTRGSSFVSRVLRVPVLASVVRGFYSSHAWMLYRWNRRYKRW